MSDWVSAVDPSSGATYYTNTVTLESRWTVPEGYVPPAESAATVWEERIDEASGAIYYFNLVTEESQWERPPDFNPAVAVDPNSIAANWNMLTDEGSGACYYLNSVTGLSQWDMPTCLMIEEMASLNILPAQEAVAEPAPVAEEAAPSRPRGLSSGIQLPKVQGRASLRPSVRLGAFETLAIETEAAQEEVAQAATPLPPPPPLEKKSAAASPDPKDLKAPPNEPVSVSDLVAAAADSAVTEKSESAAPVAAKSPPKPFKIVDDVSTEELIRQTEGHSIEDYGNKYFNFDRKGLFGRKTTIEKLLGWKDELIKTSMKSLTPELTSQAIQLYRNVTGFCGERSSGKPPLEHGSKILKNMLMAPEELRDEMFCQIVKQTRGNPSPDNSESAWRLMYFCLSTFSPSQNLMLSLMAYCVTALGDPNPEIAKIATCCLHYIPKMCKYGTRNNIPSRMELEAVYRLENSIIKVFFMDSRYVELSVNSWTTVAEVVLKVCNMIGIPPSRRKAYGMFESNDKDEERPLDNEERAMELIGGWERTCLDASEEQAVQKGGAAGAGTEAAEAHLPAFFFLFKIFHYLDYPEGSNPLPIETELEYAQAVSEVIHSKYPCSEQDALALAALQLQEEHADHPGGDCSEYVHLRLKLYVAKKFFQGNKPKEAELEASVLNLYSKLTGYSQLEARLSYLDYVRGWKVYGCWFFLTEPVNNKELPPHVVLGIGSKGIIVIDAGTKEYTAEYEYANIVTWGSSVNSFVVVTGTATRQIKLYFKTGQGKEMSDLLKSYVEHRRSL